MQNPRPFWQAAAPCLLGLCVCCWMLPGTGAHASAGKTADAGPTAITEIALENDCFGCATGSLLVLRSDGSATFTRTGKARHGTVDQVSQGRVARADFEQLARLIETRGVWTMKESHENPAVTDGAWTTLRVNRGAQRKEIFSREDAAPADLKAVHDAIEALKARLGLGR
jgi:hypothetical protein